MTAKTELTPLADSDVADVTGGAWSIDPNDYQESVVNWGLISADFEGSVNLKTRPQDGNFLITLADCEDSL